MKVLLFMTQFYQLGGAERLAVELAVELNRRGVHTELISMYSKDLPGVLEAEKMLLRQGIPRIHYLNMRVHPSLVSMLPAIAKLRRLLRAGQYDIIETSMISPAVLASWAVRGIKTCHVAGIHQVFRNDREKSRNHQLWKLSLRCNRRIRYYAISEYVKRAWIEYSKISPLHIRTIYNSIAEDVFNPQPDKQGIRIEYDIPDTARIILYVGRLAKYKGIDILLDAVGPLLKTHNVYLIYVGPIDPNPHGEQQSVHQVLHQMEQKIKKNGWSKRVQFQDYRKDIPRLMASADLLVHPTRMEGFGLVLAEAMAVGLPIVSTNVEGIPEVVRGTDSILVPPDDPEILQKAVSKALERSPCEIQTAIAKGQERAKSFATEKRVNSMMAYFQDIVKQF